ncbi:MAG TPA: DegT/DnrJ/EryC1/StrS family aminotransferase, partial [Paracoccaceae bacterium]|nr:DegT/DnrJ/EryC1/StrS family aminotransferase [Paracoccaceae bacterium]
GSAMFLALRRAGVMPGDPMLLNAFTLGPVPGAVLHAGARPVAVEITDDLVIDESDLARATRETGARVLLLSHMRGHLADMGRLVPLAADLGLTVIEDCAHALGAAWGDRPAGSFGLVGCFSLQSGKHVNGGEGGVLVTDDPDLAARAILHSGSYMLFDQNGTAPAREVFDRWLGECGNFSLRLGEVAAELALAQLPLLPGRAARWNRAHDRIARLLARTPGVALPRRPAAEAYVQSSLQFRLPGAGDKAMAGMVARCRARGLWLKWFGAPAEGYTSGPDDWPGRTRSLAGRTREVLRSLLDLRLSDAMSDADCDAVAAILIEELPA